ncbi:MAG TPA: hypothetical protein VFQ53_18360 [Kofleriaceae bacterium]|nr:hypothetical protein [Kofleriaceae bacterium]
MKLYGVIHVQVEGDAILREPGVLARISRALGREPDLRTGRTRASIEAAAIVDGVRAALSELGARNALSLVIDDVVVFQDRDRRDDDLGDLFLAFHEHAAVLDGFRTLRLAVEHAEAGNHLVVEVQARTEHPDTEPAVRVIVSGRIEAFEPRRGESAEAYRARVTPLLGDRRIVDLAQAAFDSFVMRCRDAIARAMPETRPAIAASEVRVEKPEAHADRRRGPRPDDPNYDPHEAHYGNPMLGMMSMAMWSSLLLMAPGIVPVDAGNAPIDDIDVAQLPSESDAASWFEDW